MFGRPDLRVAATEVDERLAILCGGRSDAREQGHEVLLRQPLNPIRRLAHYAMVWQGPGRDDLVRALSRGHRGALPLLSLVRRAAASQDRGVLRAASA
jgi:hypothetical protein